MTKKFFCPQVIAHRGASRYAPENTKAAIELAAAQGAKWIEVDLQLTQDDNIVIMHNSTVNKRTNGEGKIIKMDCADITQLDSGSWHSEKYSDQRVLSLGQLIKLLVELDINANLEIKTLVGRNIKTAMIAASIIKRYWPEGKTLPLVSSYSTNAIETMLEIFPQVPRAIIVGEWNEYWAKAVIDLKCVSINADRRVITSESLASMHETGKKVLIHTVNGLKSAVNFIEMGVDGLFTDRPDVVIEILKANKLYKGKN